MKITNIKLKLTSNNLKLLSFNLRYFYTKNNILNDNYKEVNEVKNIQENDYNLSWTLDYKNLNKLLSVKGLTKDSNLVNINNFNKIKYLVFSWNIINNLSNKIWETKKEKEFIYSLRLVLTDVKSANFKNANWLYEKILENLNKNNLLIKEGGEMNIYYVTSKLDSNIKEGYRNKIENEGLKERLPSLTEEIILKNTSNKIINKLLVKIYILSYDNFFRNFIKSDYFTSFYRESYNKFWSYPFLIIEDMSLPTFTYLFKEAGINAHGMSVTWRHKLSPLEENLSNFLYVTDLNENIQNSHLCFSDKLFTNNKIDYNLYKEIYKVQYYKNKNIVDLLCKKNTIENVQSNNKYKEIETLNNKLINIEEKSINPLVLILILRNYIIELEENKNIKFNLKRDLLLQYKNLNIEIKDLIKIHEDKTVIIDKLQQKIEKLELEILNNEKEVNIWLTEVNSKKLITQPNKELRKVLKKSGKSKKNKIIKNLMPNITELQMINETLMEKENLLKKNKLSKVETLQNIDENKRLDSQLLNEIKKVIEKKNDLEIKLKNKNEELENVKNELNMKSNISFSEEFYNSINNRDRESRLNKSNFVFNNKFTKRKFTTLSTKQNFNLDLNSPIALELKRIIENAPINEETQKAIENYLLFQSNEVYLEKINKEVIINYSRLNPEVIFYIKKHIDQIKLMINNYKNNLLILTNKKYKLTVSEKVESKILLNLDNEKILSLLLGKFLIIISFKNVLEKNNCTQLAKDLSESLIWEYFYQEHEKFKKESNSKLKDEIKLDKNLNTKPNSFESISIFINENENLSNLKLMSSDEVLIQMGIRLFNFMEEAKLIKTNIEQIDKTHKIHVYSVNSEVSNLITNFKDSINLSKKIPMLTVPKLYSKVQGIEKVGGFLLNDIRYVEPLIIKRSDMDEHSTIDDNKIYDMINNLNSTGFKINTQVLDFILKEGEKYNLITDFNMKHPLESKKINKKMKLTLHEKKSLDSFLSKKYLEKNILGLAIIFKNVNEFFIPVRLDNRGRIYCMVDYLNYQGIDLAKSLILFSKGVQIKLSDNNAINYLKIYGANCFGNGLDKKSFSERVRWVDDNEDDIINFENGKLLNEAENKLLFLAFCFEYQKYHNTKISDKSEYFSYFPIQLDATCNGFQHLSLLLGDTYIAEKVNITKPTSFEEKPMDFYYYIAVKVKELLEEIVINSELETKENLFNKFNWGNDDDNKNDNSKRKKIIESSKRLLKLKAMRKLVKLAVMVKPYNASIKSRAEYIKDNFERVLIDKKEFYKNEDGLYFSAYDFSFYSTVIDKVISKEFPKLKEFNSYLSQIAKICTILKIPIIWKVPSGLTVKQKYLKTEAIELKPFKYSKTTYKLVKLNQNKEINIFKQRRSLMPNLVHSLDASSLCLLVYNFYNISDSYDSEIKNFFAIHDCFATNYNRLDVLINIIKAVYINTYTENSFLIKFDKDIKNYIISLYTEKIFNERKDIIKTEINNKEIKLKFPDVNNVIYGLIAASGIRRSYGGLS